MWTPIPSNKNLLPVTLLVLYMQMYSQSGTGLQEIIQQNSQHKEVYHLLPLLFFNVGTARKLIMTHLQPKSMVIYE
jgi:hypothetical protein